MVIMQVEGLVQGGDSFLSHMHLTIIFSYVIQLPDLLFLTIALATGVLYLVTGEARPPWPFCIQINTPVMLSESHWDSQLNNC